MRTNPLLVICVLLLNYAVSSGQQTGTYNYTYDANGNMTYDGMRGIKITYNWLNLPQKIIKGTDTIEYIYAADGRKLATKLNGAFTQFYAGNMVYKGDKTMDYLVHDEGLAVKNGSKHDYQYNIADHLGNVRVVEDAGKTVVQANDYYPFGLTHNPVANLNKNKYLYNGKELQTGVVGGTAWNVLDYGARFYDPVIGRWDKPDPLAEQSRRWSPYAYCYNNPMRFVDPDGMQPTAIVRARKLPQMFRAVRNLSRTNEKGVPYNHFVSGDRSQEVINSLIAIGQEVENERTRIAKDEAKAATPEQTKEQKKRQSQSDVEDAEISRNHEQNMKNNNADGSGDAKGEEFRGGVIGEAIVIGGGAAGILMELTNPNPSKDPYDAHIEKAKEKTKKPNFIQQIIDWFN